MSNIHTYTALLHFLVLNMYTPPPPLLGDVLLLINHISPIPLLKPLKIGREPISSTVHITNRPVTRCY